MDRFAGRVAVVTGAGSGIGAAIAEDLVRAGMVVVGVDRKKEELDALAASLKSAKGQLHSLYAELTKTGEVRRVFQWVEDNVGGVSIVVNNAGMCSGLPVQDEDTATIENIITTNLTAVTLGCKEAINSMRKHDIKDGHIINISSLAGQCIMKPSTLGKSLSTYVSSKHGVTALTKALRYDVQQLPGFKIRVTCISPSGVRTNMIGKKYLDNLPDPDCILNTTDISGAIIYVLSCPPGVEITELTIRPVAETIV